MNYLQRQNRRKELKNMLSNHYSEGTLKITSGEGHLHAKVKAEVFHWLKCNGYDVYSEANLKGYGGRPDIVAIHSNGTGIIVEIHSSETEKQASLKRDKYPKEFYLLEVNAKTFLYDTFAI
jgi:competence CoiA-like predicted nuclease